MTKEQVEKERAKAEEIARAKREETRPKDAEPKDVELPREGSINEPPGSNVLDRELPDVVPVLATIDPVESPIGGPDIALACLGSHFTPDAVITIDGGDVGTTYVNTTRVTTMIKPSIADPGTFAIAVKQAGGTSEPLDFTFTALRAGNEDDEDDERDDKAKPKRHR